MGSNASPTEENTCFGGNVRNQLTTGSASIAVGYHLFQNAMDDMEIGSILSMENANVGGLITGPQHIFAQWGSCLYPQKQQK